MKYYKFKKAIIEKDGKKRVYDLRVIDNGSFVEAYYSGEPTSDFNIFKINGGDELESEFLRNQSKYIGVTEINLSEYKDLNETTAIYKLIV